MEHSVIPEHWLLHIGPLTFHGDMVLISLGVDLFLLGLAFFATRRMKIVPGRLQNLMEMTVEFIEKMARDNMGEKGLVYVPFFATLFLYILVANMAGLVPFLKSPTADVNVTLGLAATVILFMQYISIREHGAWGWFKHFFKPYPFFIVVHLLELVTRPLSLALRLFGNIFSGEVMIGILYMLLPQVVPVLWLALSIAIGAIQAYIFTVLSLAYTGTAVQE